VDPVDEIRQLYFNATRTTIERDLRRAVTLLKSLPDEETRARAAVFMDGLAQMRSEWAGAMRGSKSRKPHLRTRRSARR
jgi:hypothetical protein